MEIGIDSIENSRFDEKVISNNKLMEKIFTYNEINYCKKKNDPSQHFAARFTAKEAVKKAFSTKKISIPFNKIEILNEKSGRPYVRIINDYNKKFIIKISMSHNFTTSFSVALIYKNGD